MCCLGVLLPQRHAKSLKRLAAGKLKVQLNSDGEEEDEAETHSERLERIRRVAEVSRCILQWMKSLSLFFLSILDHDLSRTCVVLDEFLISTRCFRKR